MDARGVLLPTTPGCAVPVAEITDAGQVLREARMRAGFNLNDIADELKISIHYLQAIEDQDRDALPSRAYTLGFVRCYANHLGFKAQAIVDQFDVVGRAKSTPHRDLTARRTPFWLDFNVPKGAGFSVAMLGILGLATWFGTRTEPVARTTPPVPELLETWSHSVDLHAIPAIAPEPAQIPVQQDPVQKEPGTG